MFRHRTARRAGRWRRRLLRPRIGAMRCLAILCLFVAMAIPPPAAAAERPRPRPLAERCTPDGSACIRLSHYAEDVCALIETAALGQGLDPGYLARLIWQESLFDAVAVSPAGAQGIAQFMPATAARRGLREPFNPAAAILAAADYLADLRRLFGNEGLAAAAYNSGEARTGDFVATGRTLPAETRAYVQIITGHSARTWRDAPPGRIDFRLSPALEFRAACRAQAATRAVQRLSPEPPPWGAVIASGRRRATVESLAARVRRAHGPVIGARAIEIAAGRMPGFGPRRRLVARVVASSRSDALTLCKRLRRAGAFCTVTGPG